MFALGSALGWSVYKLTLRRGGETYDIGAGYLLTMIITAVFNTAYAVIANPTPRPEVGVGLALTYFAFSGIFSTLLGRWFLFGSIFTMGPSRAGAWANAAPVYTLVIAWITLGDRPEWLAILGMLTTLSGILALTRESMSGNIIPGSSSPVWKPTTAGLLMAFGSGLAFAGGTVFRKAGLNVWSDPMLGNAVSGVAALACYLPFALYKGDLRTLLARRKGSGMGFFAAAGVCASLAQLLLYLSLTSTSAAIAQSVVAVDSLFTLVLTGWLLRGRERRTPTLVGAVLLITLGLVLVSL